MWDCYSSDDSPGLAEIALVVDPSGALLVNDASSEANRFHRDLSHLLNKTGAPFEAVSFDDLLQPGVADKYKLLIFASVFELDEQQIHNYYTYVARSGRTIVWLYAAGISNGKCIDLERNRQITGVSFGTPDASQMEHENHRTVYLYKPETLTSKMLRELARNAGVLLWTQEDAPVFANARLAAFHTATGGKQLLSFPSNVSRVMELYTNQHFELVNHQLEYNFNRPDTVLFEMFYSR